MIVDVHVHPPSHRDRVPPNERRTDLVMRSGSPVSTTNSVADFMEAMAVVDKAIVFASAPAPSRPDFAILHFDGWPPTMWYNDITAEVASRAPDKLIPFMSVHPLDPRADEEYDRAVGDLGCKGMKLAPPYQFFDPTGEEAFKLYGRLERDGLPILFHQGTSPVWDAPLMYGHPLLMDRIAMAFPRLKIVMAHLGHPWHTDTINVVRKHANVWADVSAQCLRPWSFWNAMRLFHEWGVMHKLLLGSDWPITTPRETIDGLRGLARFARDHHLPEVPEAEIEDIVNRDALDILGLD